MFEHETCGCLLDHTGQTSAAGLPHPHQTQNLSLNQSTTLMQSHWQVRSTRMSTSQQCPPSSVPRRRAPTSMWVIARQYNGSVAVLLRSSDLPRTEGVQRPLLRARVEWQLYSCVSSKDERGISVHRIAIGPRTPHTMRAVKPAHRRRKSLSEM